MLLKRKGFTLIELLVVIAIIAILAAILFPVFTKAKEKGKQTKCSNNLTQIARGMTMYGDDWNGRFPWAYEWKPAPPQVNIYGALRKYVSGGKAVFACPSDSGDIAAEKFGQAGKKWCEVFDTSYNWPGVNYIGSWPHLAGLIMASPTIANPPAAQLRVWSKPVSKRIMMFDGRPWHNLKNKGATWSALEGLTVMSFCDGHAGVMDNRKALYELGILNTP